MSEDVICFVNSPDVVIVARIVSPGCVSSCWNWIVGMADIVGNAKQRIQNKPNEKVILCFILFRHVSKFFESF